MKSKNMLAATFVLASAALVGCSSLSGAGDAATPAVTPPTASSDGVLTSPAGFALYTFKKDEKNAGSSNCYQECAKNWPPLYAAPESRASGGFAILIREDGSRQWTYKGMPLYQYAHDAKGQRTGDGKGDGAWSLAKP